MASVPVVRTGVSDSEQGSARGPLQMPPDASDAARSEPPVGNDDFYLREVENLIACTEEEVGGDGDDAHADSDAHLSDPLMMPPDPLGGASLPGLASNQEFTEFHSDDLETDAQSESAAMRASRLKPPRMLHMFDHTGSDESNVSVDGVERNMRTSMNTSMNASRASRDDIIRAWFDASGRINAAKMERRASDSNSSKMFAEDLKDDGDEPSSVFHSCRRKPAGSFGSSPFASSGRAGSVQFSEKVKVVIFSKKKKKKPERANSMDVTDILRDTAGGEGTPPSIEALARDQQNLDKAIDELAQRMTSPRGLALKHDSKR
ncbi:hypothetical protein FVE85_0484 [Porphyridium purpureum]|uniref:Uncharacterized protein n=1 Tax=Porphyridium purpureum TaxID=35688 RepID=A0A5J4Z017_PORPP|nr:hypothetical protein FVE85_0484 [Porphyridium purpureum]|eukprot:POR2984..scf208_2